MKKYLYALKTCPLFADITDDNISAMTNCLDMRVKKYSKGEYIYNSGDYLKSVSIVAEGSLFLQKDDLFGNRTIVRKLNVGDIFGEAYAVQNDEPLLNDVTANEDSVILSFQMSKILSQCNNVCEFHAKLIENLIRSISEKNRILTKRMDCISKRSTRDKLLTYLMSESEINQSREFTIPLNRKQLADFLSVDRSAMSNELCKMRDEGLLEFNRCHFKLLL